MRKKPISALLIALVVVVGIPSFAFASDIAVAKVAIGEGAAVTNQGNNQAISTTGSNESVKPDTTIVEQPGSSGENGSIIENDDSAEQNKDTVKDESGKLPVAEEPVVEKPVVEAPTVEEPVVTEPAIEEPKAEEPKAEEPKAEEPAVTEPAIVVEEPAVTEPAIVVQEPVVTEPAIVVEEPVATTLTIKHVLKMDEGSIEKSETIENVALNQKVNLAGYIHETDNIKCSNKLEEVNIDEINKVLTFYYVLEKVEKEDLSTDENSMER
ncbi:MAG: hypothetical protein AB9836_12560 [Aminipila sp.]